MATPWRPHGDLMATPPRTHQPRPKRQIGGNAEISASLVRFAHLHVLQRLKARAFCNVQDQKQAQSKKARMHATSLHASPASTWALPAPRANVYGTSVRSSRDATAPHATVLAVRVAARCTAHKDTSIDRSSVHRHPSIQGMTPLPPSTPLGSHLAQTTTYASTSR